MELLENPMFIAIVFYGILILAFGLIFIVKNHFEKKTKK